MNRRTYLFCTMTYSEFFAQMYDSLGELSEMLIPYFEEVWVYSKAKQFYKGGDNSDDNYDYN